MNKELTKKELLSLLGKMSKEVDFGVTKTEMKAMKVAELRKLVTEGEGVLGTTGEKSEEAPPAEPTPEPKTEPTVEAVAEGEEPAKDVEPLNKSPKTAEGALKSFKPDGVHHVLTFDSGTKFFIVNPRGQRITPVLDFANEDLRRQNVKAASRHNNKNSGIRTLINARKKEAKKLGREYRVQLTIAL